jgi:hypothetical protein
MKKTEKLRGMAMKRTKGWQPRTCGREHHVTYYYNDIYIDAKKVTEHPG